MNRIQEETTLRGLMSRKEGCNIYLTNGVKLIGTIVDYDDVCIVLNHTLEKNNSVVTQIIYKHAISTVVPCKTTEKG